MGKKSFREKLNQIVTTTVEKTKDKKMKSTFSRKMYNEVVTALVNDPDYEMETVQVKNNVPTAVVTKPVRAFREKLLSPILADLKVDNEDAKKYIENYEFTKSQTENFYDLACSSIYEYMKIGKTFRLPSKEDFVAAISIRKMEPKLYVNTRTGKKSQREGYDSLVKKSVCPLWKRHEV